MKVVIKLTKSRKIDMRGKNKKKRLTDEERKLNET